MEHDQIRQRISFGAARLLHSRRVRNYHDARWQAARAITRSYLPGESLPTDMEIRVQLQQLMGSDGAFPHSLPGPETPRDDGLPDDRFDHYSALLLPLDRIVQPRVEHPEGDVLYHSLQVFELTFASHPWDEELLTAALLHDVGKGIDPRDGHDAGLRALTGYVTARTLWLIDNLPSAHRHFEGVLGARGRRRLVSSDWWDELSSLTNHDLEGRVPGRKVRSVDHAIHYIRQLGTSESESLASQ
jgi:hypothetical protein